MKVEVRRDEGRSHQTATAQVMETTVEDHKQTCCDHRVKMCARTAEYEEELCGAKEEKEPQRQLLDAAFNLQPRIVLHRADFRAVQCYTGIPSGSAPGEEGKKIKRARKGGGRRQKKEKKKVEGRVLLVYLHTRFCLRNERKRARAQGRRNIPSIPRSSR
ncbi:uncharacterized protein LOC133472567 isoform X9 [Phyllopteryx taeniolatus]|uniref:uncharacterized protein LOC133472567 isoform X9 n=1 Tax=Phyllopteryx taeniolatus TaxID=161469 RepID=UPI002AD1D307|nr:uncharacterized protein LOC133472567 isoform X9 [Phyllopteryx taeniolatus]